MLFPKGGSVITRSQKASLISLKLLAEPQYSVGFAIGESPILHLTLRPATSSAQDKCCRSNSLFATISHGVSRHSRVSSNPEMHEDQLPRPSAGKTQFSTTFGFG